MKMLARMSRIFEQLNGAWDVLRTMTPSEYTRFRSQLGSPLASSHGSTVDRIPARQPQPRHAQAARA